MISHFSMTEIRKANTPNGYYINGKGLLLDNWTFHKKTSLFSEIEKRDFDKYILDYKL
jgi:hypothetical protein